MGNSSCLIDVKHLQGGAAIYTKLETLDSKLDSSTWVNLHFV